MSVLGEHMMSGSSPPLVPGLWRPALWCTPTPGPRVPEIPVYPPQPVTHLFRDYLTTHSAPLWYPWYFKGDALYDGSSTRRNDRDSPSKELPSRLLKLDRSKDRQELSHTLNFDRDHVNRLNSRKSAGTQTQFTSFNSECYPPPYYPRDGAPTESSYPLPPMYLPPPPPPPPLPPQSHPSHDQTGVRLPERRPSPDVQNAPLNLSLTSASPPLSSRPPSGQQLRPSVITCTAPSRYGRSPSPVESASPPDGQQPPVSDPDIEEHFRRSLGRNYKDVGLQSAKVTSATTLSTTTAATPATPATPATTAQTNVSITGSVDDHFAKSLGDTTWTAIKAKADPVTDMFAGSVDDHFAKALGDTWLRIKAEKENNCHNSTCSSPSGSPQQSSVVT